MSSVEQLKQRVGVLVELLKRSNSLGRTAVMKLMFFLQELKGVDLGYQFRIYTYGPFDSSVLEDLSYAESLGIINSEIESFPNGYSYKYQNNPQCELNMSKAQEFIESHQDSIAWVSGKFGKMNASELELLSTIVYVDRLYHQYGDKVSINEICEKVKKIKTHFSEDYILNNAQDLLSINLLISVNEFNSYSHCG